METALWEVVVRSLVIYLVILVALRLLGKREISQFTPFDLVLLMLLANVVQNSMTGTNATVQAALAAGLALLAANFALNRLLARHMKLRRLVEGTPAILIRHGHVEWRVLRHEHLDIDTLRTALREHGIDQPHDVDLAVLEVDGSISVIPVQGPEKSQKRTMKRKGNVKFQKRS
jgi:uncharacterized membrane protein YcaP (DUF421 family)